MAKLKPYAILFLLGLALGAGVYGLWYNNDYSRAARDLPRQIREAKAEGLALEPADLVRTPPLKPADNAADRMAALAAEVKLHQADTLSLARLYDPRVDWKKDLPAAVKAIPACRHLFEIAAEAAAKPDCEFQLDYTSPRATAELFISLSGATEALAGKAIVESKQGHREAAWASLQTAARICGHIGRAPQLIALLTQQLGEIEACDAVASILVAEDGRPEALAGARQVMKVLGPPADLRFTLRGDLVVGRSTIERMRHSNAPFGELGIGASRGGPLARSATACDAYDARLIEAYRGLYRTLGEKGGLRSVRQSLDALRASRGRSRPSEAYNDYALVLLASVPGQIELAIARRRLALTAIALYEYRARHGEFPAALPAQGADSLDPFDDQPLRYRRAGRGFVLYSIGPDLKDGNGVGPDVVFGLP